MNIFEKLDISSELTYRTIMVLFPLIAILSAIGCNRVQDYYIVDLGLTFKIFNIDGNEYELVIYEQKPDSSNVLINFYAPTECSRKLILVFPVEDEEEIFILDEGEHVVDWTSSDFKITHVVGQDYQDWSTDKTLSDSVLFDIESIKLEIGPYAQSIQIWRDDPRVIFPVPRL
ncbi:MAG: hypothetical protein K2H72_02885 [Muribaculaceae bacterium]|nr:hypothetical protein [Muribaculaceae bacterium]